MDIIFRNGKVVTPSSIFRGGIAVNRGKIVAVASDIHLPNAEDVVDLGGNIVLPGIIDNHVHFGARPQTDKEDFESGLHDLIKRTQAAGARVIVCTPSVIGEKTDGTNEFDEMLDEYSDISRKVAQVTGCQLLDLRKSFMAYLREYNTDNLAEGILTRDMVHLNQQGNTFLSGLVLEALNVRHNY